MYLVDTNVWLERILDQAKSEEVGQFLDRTPAEPLFITDFAFHSIGVILAKLNRRDAFLYAAAEKYNLAIVSFDADFDRTRLGRKAPAEL